MNVYWLSRDGVVHGPYDQHALQRWLIEGTLYEADQLTEEGSGDWVAALAWAEDRVREGLTKTERSKKPLELRSFKQSALLRYLGEPVPLSKVAASDSIDLLWNNPTHWEKKEAWLVDRLFLYPDVYQEELSKFWINQKSIKEGRAEDLWDHVNQDLGEFHPFHRLTKAECRTVVEWLDTHFDGWSVNAKGHYTTVNGNEAMSKNFYKGVSLALPEKVKKGWQGVIL